jgi:hypothetical protein
VPLHQLGERRFVPVLSEAVKQGGIVGHGST